MQILHHNFTEADLAIFNESKSHNLITLVKSTAIFAVAMAGFFVNQWFLLAEIILCLLNIFMSIVMIFGCLPKFRPEGQRESLIKDFRGFSVTGLPFGSDWRRSIVNLIMIIYNLIIIQLAFYIGWVGLGRLVIIGMVFWIAVQIVVGLRYIEIVTDGKPKA